MNYSPLTPEEASIGIKHCINNAIAKFDDAEILFNGKKYSSAFSLYVIALQELGKIKIIVEIAKLRKDQQVGLKDLWNKFRNHKMKDFMGDFFQVSGKGGSKVVMSEYTRLLTENKIFSPENIRLESLYVDFDLEKRLWKFPQNGVEDTSTIRAKVEKTLIEVKRLEEAGFYSKEYIREYTEFYQTYFSNVFDKLIDDPQAFAEEADKQYWKDLNFQFVTTLIKKGVLKKLPKK